MAEHALLSASGSERWIQCQPSARLEEAVDEETSEYAKEGSFAHSPGRNISGSPFGVNQKK
jgi:hypothetical protein